MFRSSGVLTASLLAMLAVAVNAWSTPPRQQASNPLRAEQVIAAWKPTPKDVAQQMLAKYGQPQEVTANRLVWHDNGPWKFTELVNEEVPHDFPVPHKDALYQAIDYRIDPSKADDLLLYDGSLLLERTKGEIGARCDKEDANFLAINLAHDVATGKRSVEEARKFYADSMMALMKEGKKNDYLQGFVFKVSDADQGDRDKPFTMTK